MIKATLFDLREVVLTNDWHYDCPEKFKAYSNHFGITYDQMEKGWKIAWPLYEIGKITEKKFWELFLRNAGASKIDVDKAKKFWRKYIGSKPGIFNLLKKLKGHYKLGILFSTGKEWLEYKIKRYKLNSYFSLYITTSNTGFRKTNKKIYQIAIKKLHVLPEEILFIDDTNKVLKVAQKLKIKTMLFKNSKQLLKELSNLKLLS